MTIDVLLDTETFSPTPLKHGLYKYAERVEVMVVSYSIDDERVRVWDVDDEPMPADLAAAFSNPEAIFTAHNSMFDRTVLRMGQLKIDIPIEQWRCTLVQAHSYALPGKLATLCRVMKVPLDEHKLTSGNRLIRLFCMPQKDETRANRYTHPQEWIEFLDYAGGDIVAMRAVRARMPRWNDTEIERKIWFADQRMNDRGFTIDMPYVERVVDVIKAAEAVISARTVVLTDGVVERVSQRDRLLGAILAQFGVALPDLQAATIERRLEDPDLPGVVKELLELRQDGARTSTAKYKTLIRSTNRDGRMRGTTQHNGAGRTGRGAGRLFQCQNLVRPPKSCKPWIKDYIKAVKAGIATQVFTNVLEMASASMRGAIIAAPGKMLRVADKSAIENRMGAWLAGEQWKLDAYRDYDAGVGPDLYELSYAKAFHVPIHFVQADTKAGGGMRQLGKVNELSLMYQGAAGAWAAMAAIYGVTDTTLDVIDANVKGYRDSNREIKTHWRELQDGALRALTSHAGGWVEVRRLAFRKQGAWLQLRIPSGRILSYANASVEEGGKITFVGMDQYTRKWSRQKIYGGKFFAHATQASARDELLYDIPRIEAAGMDTLMLVHDEAVTESDENRAGALIELRDIISTPHEWCKDLPLACSGFEDYRYGKD